MARRVLVRASLSSRSSRRRGFFRATSSVAPVRERASDRDRRRHLHDPEVRRFESRWNRLKKYHANRRTSPSGDRISPGSGASAGLLESSSISSAETPADVASAAPAAWALARAFAAARSTPPPSSAPEFSYSQTDARRSRRTRPTTRAARAAATRRSWRWPRWRAARAPRRWTRARRVQRRRRQTRARRTRRRSPRRGGR